MSSFMEEYFSWIKYQWIFSRFTQLIFTTNEMELKYYHEEVNVRVPSTIAERHKT